MVRRHQDRVTILVLSAPDPRNGLSRLQKRLRRELAERHDDLGLDGFNLPEEERLALLHFVGLGIPVLRITLAM